MVPLDAGHRRSDTVSDTGSDTGSDTVIISAPAKLTTTLTVTGVRPDGYHLIDAEMVSLDLVDVITIEPESEGLTIDGPYSAGVSVGDDNLVARALRLAGRRAAVHIDKRIPHGGGLGGGSADAAAVLRWAGYTDLVAAASIGADIPFCLIGGRARVTGIGEIVEPLTHRELTVTLVIPPFGVSTPAVYRAWDELGGPHHPHNDLEPAALVVEPRLAEIRSAIDAACDGEPILAGSGATWFVVGDHRHELDDLVDDLGATVLLARALD